jgi:hypothetical protein
MTLLALAAACAHDAPFTPTTFGADSTLTRGQDRQLTYNLGTDRTPSWRADGGGLLYMFEAIDLDPRDRCIGELPPAGGTIRRTVCPVSAGSIDSLDAWYEPASGPDNRLLYLRESSIPGRLSPDQSALVLADGSDPLAATTLRPYPYTAQNGKLHQGISHIRWLSATSAVYLAEKVLYIGECPACPPDTVRTGIEIVRIDLAGPAPAFSIVPNSDETSSIGTGPGPDEVIITRNGDSRVFQLTLSTGTLNPIYDFGPGRIVRDVQVTGNRMYAIVGGAVTFTVDPVFGAIQRDKVGQLVAVDLDTGHSSPMFVSDRLFRRPVLSPDGRRMVAEGFVAIITGPGGADTTLSPLADLWLFDIP